MKIYRHETTVLGLFQNPEKAKGAIANMVSEKIRPEDVHLVTNQEQFAREELVEVPGGEKVHEEAIRSAKVGSVTGAILAGAAAITGFVTAGASLIATVPLIAVVTGAGGILGGLLEMGFTDTEASQWDEAIDQGKALLVVHTPDREVAKAAKEFLNQSGAEKVHMHH